MKKGLGCTLDRAEIIAGDMRTHHVARLVGASTPARDVVDWTDRLDAVVDQQHTNVCVAASLSTALYLAGQAAGSPIARPSIRHLYATSYWLDTPGAPISPGGRSVRRAAKAARDHGLVAEARWPFDVAKVTEPFPLDLDVAAADARVTAWYTAGGGDLPAQLRAALAAGHFPVIVMMVRESFDAYRRGIYVPSGRARGWHAVVAGAYSPGTVTLINSWGYAHGDTGLVHVSDDYLSSPEVADCVVVTGAPSEVR